MAIIGLLGGMSWESSASYYQIINREVRARLGGQHSARVLLYSLDFALIAELQRDGRWDEASLLLVDGVRRLVRGGAEVLLLCTNTMHKLADVVARAAGVSLLNIIDVTAAAAARQGLECVGLLGTRYTMEEDFYRGRLCARHGLTVLVPDERGRQLVDDVIYRELCQGVISPQSKQRIEEVIFELGRRGAEGVILGCTELPLLIGPADIPLPILDTTRLHALAAVEAALARTLS